MYIMQYLLSMLLILSEMFTNWNNNFWTIYLFYLFLHTQEHPASRYLYLNCNLDINKAVKFISRNKKKVGRLSCKYNIIVALSYVLFFRAREPM